MQAVHVGEGKAKAVSSVGGAELFPSTVSIYHSSMFVALFLSHLVVGGSLLDRDFFLIRFRVSFGQRVQSFVICDDHVRCLW